MLVRLLSYSVMKRSNINIKKQFEISNNASKKTQTLLFGVGFFVMFCVFVFFKKHIHM